MRFSCKILKAHKNDLNVSTSKNVLNVSYTFHVDFGKINIPLLGKRKKSLWTNKGSRLFSHYL